MKFRLFRIEGGKSLLVEGVLLLQEARTYEFRLESDLVDAQLSFHGASVNVDADGRFVLDVGHWVGSANLTLKTNTGVRSLPVQVLPNEDKLSEELWASMVQDLEGWLGGSTAGLEGGRDGRVGKAGVPAPLIAEALLPLLPQLERAVRVLIASPRTLDTTVLEEVAIHQVRHVNRETLRWLSQHPQAYAQVHPHAYLEAPRQQTPILARRTTDTLNHPANRYVSWLIRRIVDVLTATAAKLELAPNALDKVNWRGLRARQLQEGAGRLLLLWRQSFLAVIPREPVSEASLQTVFNDPHYLRVHKLGRLFIHPLFRSIGDAELPQAAVRPSFGIYELWCFFRLAEIMQHSMPNYRWRAYGLDRLIEPLGNGEGAGFSATNAQGDCVEILYNPTFRGFLTRGQSQRWSISAERRPDMVVTYKPNDKEGRYVILDAKYRVSEKALGQAFESAHIYRDSLRYEGFGGKCRAAILLAPNMIEKTKAWFDAEFLDKNKVGVWELKPGIESPVLTDRLTNSLVG